MCIYVHLLWFKAIQPEDMKYSQCKMLNNIYWTPFVYVL